MDQIWSSARSAGGRVLNAMGYGAQDGWGARPLGLAPEAESALRQAGVFNDYQSGHDSLVKSFNEAIIRPAASAADLLMRAPSAALTAIGAGAEQTEREAAGPADQNPGAVRRGIAGVAGAASELSYGAAEGAIFPDLAAGPTAHSGIVSGASEAVGAERVLDAARARAAGVVGEGEAGFYDAEPPTPQNVQARQDAAREAGIDEPLPTTPPAPDLHQLARRVDPETFQTFDALAADREAARGDLERLTSEDREERPEVAEARRNLNELIGLEPDTPARAGAFEERLRAIAQSAPDDLLDRVATAYDHLDSLLTEDTPEMAQARGRLMDADLAMREMAPQVSEAYRHASDLLPETPTTATAPIEPQAAGEKPPKGKEGEPGAPGGEPEGAAQGHAPPAVAISGEAEPVFLPPDVLGGEKLGDQPPPEGHVRMYHGGSMHEPGHPLWFTSHLPKAEGYASKSGGEVQFVDLPEDHPLIAPEYPEQSVKNGFTVERELPADLADLRKPMSEPVAAVAPEAAKTPSTEGAPKPRTVGHGNLKEIPGTGDLKARSLSQGVEAKAIEEGLASSFGDLPEYHSISMAEQAEAAAKLISDDFDHAKAVAMGERAAPKGLLPESVFVAVEKHALATGDVDTLRQLGTRSKLSTAATTMGQRIRTLREREQASPVGAIHEVQAAREAALKAKNVDIDAAKAEIANEIKAEMRKGATVKADAWADFLGALKCGE